MTKHVVPELRSIPLTFLDCSGYKERRCPMINGMVAPFDPFCEWMRVDNIYPRGFR
jgi:hypothetical protein